MQASAIGIDIGGTKLRAARVRADGTLDQHSSETIERDPETILRRLIELCRDLDRNDVIGVGLGYPGRVDARRRLVLSGGYIDMAGSRIVERLEQAIGKPVGLDNDCNMALVAEMACGAARGVDHVVMLTIGTGIGGALALDGRIVRGNATAGQLGHLTASGEDIVCNCGRRGCVETTSSGTALSRLIAEAGLPSTTRVEDLLAADDESRAATVLRRWIGPLRSAIDSMVAAVAPDLVLLGGGLGNSARRALERAPALSPWYQCRVEVAELGDEAGVIGAALSVLRCHADRERGGKFG